MTAFTWLVVLTLRATVVVGVALALASRLRRGSAEVRHRLLTLTAIGLLLLPALPVVLPSWTLPWELPALRTPAPAMEPLQTSAARAAMAPAHVAAPRLARDARTAAPAPDAVSFAAAFGAAAIALWLAGVLASLAALVRALHRERRLVAESRPLAGEWLETVAEVRRSVELSGPIDLLVSERVRAPLTGGWLRPAVVLPPSATGWSEERRRLVAQHELLHIASGDCLRRLAWRLVAALYWFHPLVRRAERVAREASEHACDERVVRLGARPSIYARHLLEIADGLRSPAPALASALPMVERSQLERRLFMILEAPGRGGHAPAAVGLVLLAGTVLGAAAASPNAGAKAAGVALAVPVAAAGEARPADAHVAECFSGFNGRIDDESGNESILSHQLAGGRWLCARIHGKVRFDERTGAIAELPEGSWVLVETRDRRGGGSQRMMITSEHGQPRHQWWRNGVSQPVDEPARAWLASALQVASGLNQIGSIQGHVGSLQGAIGSIQGEIGSLQGQIGSIQGEEGSLQGKIGSIEGERGSLQGRIGSHQGAIGSLQGSRWPASAAEEERIERQIKEHEAAIRKLEEELQNGDLARRLAEAQARLQEFQHSGAQRIAELERQIKTIHVEDRIGALERQIKDVHAEERIREIEQRTKPALERLEALIRELGR